MQKVDEYIILSSSHIFFSLYASLSIISPFELHDQISRAKKKGRAKRHRTQI